MSQEVSGAEKVHQIAPGITAPDIGSFSSHSIVGAGIDPVTTQIELRPSSRENTPNVESTSNTPSIVGPGLTSSSSSAGAEVKRVESTQTALDQNAPVAGKSTTFTTTASDLVAVAGTTKSLNSINSNTETNPTVSQPQGPEVVQRVSVGKIIPTLTQAEMDQRNAHAVQLGKGIPFPNNLGPAPKILSPNEILSKPIDEISLEGMKEAVGGLRGIVETLQSELAQSRAEMSSRSAALNDTLAALRREMDLLRQENTTLRETVMRMSQHSTAGSAGGPNWTSPTMNPQTATGPAASNTSPSASVDKGTAWFSPAFEQMAKPETRLNIEPTLHTGLPLRDVLRDLRSSSPELRIGQDQVHIYEDPRGQIHAIVARPYSSDNKHQPAISFLLASPQTEADPTIRMELARTRLQKLAEGIDTTGNVFTDGKRAKDVPLLAENLFMLNVLGVSRISGMVDTRVEHKNWSGVDMNYAVLDNVTFFGNKEQRMLMADVQAVGLELKNTKIIGVYARGMRMDSANASNGCEFLKTDFAGGSWNGINLNGTVLKEVNLHGVDALGMRHRALRPDIDKREYLQYFRDIEFDTKDAVGGVNGPTRLDSSTEKIMTSSDLRPFPWKDQVLGTWRLTPKEKEVIHKPLEESEVLDFIRTLPGLQMIADRRVPGPGSDIERQEIVFARNDGSFLVLSDAVKGSSPGTFEFSVVDKDDQLIPDEIPEVGGTNRADRKAVLASVWSRGTSGMKASASPPAFNEVMEAAAQGVA